MPPKKKKGKEGSDGGGGRKENKGEKGKMGEAVPEGSKEFYEMQIRDLEDRLERYQKKWDEVSAKESLYQSQLKQVSGDKSEIVSFLKRTLNERLDEISDLKDQLTALHQDHVAEKASYEAQLAEMRLESQKTKDQLTAENMMLAGKLASLEEFRVEKEELMSKFAALEEKLQTQEEEHNAMMYRVEKKAVLDQDRLKKEMVHRVNNLAAEFSRISNDQMEETTKRTIRENASISSQLSKISNKCIELTRENELLKEQEMELRRQVEILEENEKELLRNKLSNRKVLNMLKEKCQNQEEILELAMQTENNLSHLKQDHQILLEETQKLRQENISLEEEVHRLRDERGQLNGQLEEEKRRTEALELVLGQAAFALKDILMEHPSEEAAKEEEVSIEKHNQMLQGLLLILNSAASLGLGPSLIDFQSKKPHYAEYYMTSKNQRQMALPVLKGPGVAPHYQIGDLGLVPRTDIKKPILSKTADLSRTTRLGLIKDNIVEKDLRTPQQTKLQKNKTLPRIYVN